MVQPLEDKLTTALALAYAAWGSSRGLDVSDKNRYAIYRAFGPPGDRQAVGCRTQLSLLAARRVAVIYGEAVRAIEKPGEPATPSMQRLITTATGVLSGDVSYEQALMEVFDGTDTVSGLGDVADQRGLGDSIWVLTQRARYAYGAAQAALVTALYGSRLEEYRPPMGVIGHAVSRDGIALDAAALAALAEAWRGDALPLNEARLRAYWRWWLEEAVPVAAEWRPAQ